MCDNVLDIRSLAELRTHIHQTLCQKENLLMDQFHMSELQLTRRGRVCGLQFSLQGPRSVRLGAIWAADHNMIYFYDAKGSRYMKARLRNRLEIEEPTSEGSAAA